MAARGVVAGGRFRLDRPIGDGGMSSVWAAHDEQLGRTVAVKIVPAAKDDPVARRFRREARIIRSLSHRNIVSVIDAGEIPEEGLLFLAMELLHGSPLSNHIQAGEPVPAIDILPVLVEVCRGLEAAHAAGVIHRDMKPENVFLALVDGEGVVPKILDFGLSTAGDRKNQTRITADNQVIGTPIYMSPEQAQARQDVTAASDVWSMGVILYEAVTGKLPFPGTNVGLVLDSIVYGVPAPVPVEVDPWTRAIIARCLRKDPVNRYADAAALRADMEKAIAALSGQPAPVHDEDDPPSEPRAALADPEHVAAEPPITRPGRGRRHALARARSPVIIALVAVALCVAAVAAVPRHHRAGRAEAWIARAVRALRVK